MSKPYKNKEYIDWIREGKLLEDTVLEGADRVTLPEKMTLRNMALLIFGIFNGASVIVEYSPDFMETPQAELVPATMRWYSRTDGIWTAADLIIQDIWENLNGAEGWFRIRVIDVDAATDISVKTRPRVQIDV